MTAPIPPWDGGDPPWARAYPAGVPITYPYPQVGLARLLEDAAQDFPDATAIEYRRYRLSYRKVADHADRFATALEALGVGPGMQVVLVLPNCPQLVIALFAVWRIGAGIRVSTPAMVGHLSGEQTAAVVVLDRWYMGSVAPLRDVLDDVPVIVTGVGDYLAFPDNALVPLWNLLRRRGVRIPRDHDVLGFADQVRRNLPATGSPDDANRQVALWWSGGQMTQQQLVVNGFQLRLWLPDVVAGDERVLLALPQAAPVAALWIVMSVLAAAAMLMVDGRPAAARRRAVARARPTILPFDRGLARQMLRHSRRRPVLSSVRIAVTRDDLDDQRRRAIEQVTDKGRVRRVWGIAGTLTHADPVYGRYVEQTAGLPLSDTAAVVADPSDPRRAAPPGVAGRLWLRGPQLADDQWIDGRTTAAIDASGYLTVHATDDSGTAQPWAL